jgi:hypothetical protein
MIGKKNIVFGFLYLFLTASLGPLMIVKHFEGRRIAEVAKQEQMSALQQIVADDYEVNLVGLSPMDLAKRNTEAILSLSRREHAQNPINSIRTGPHAHGNLEALLNIAAGFLLMFLAIPRRYKQALSWMFIVSTLLHSGMLYVVIGLDQRWAAPMVNGLPFALSAGLVLLSILAAGVAAAVGLRAEPVPD